MTNHPARPPFSEVPRVVPKGLFVHFCLSRVASTPRLILVIAALVAPITLLGCGSRSGGQSAEALPPAIPAAEPVLLYDGTGASASDVLAVEAVLGTLGVGYATADSSQLNAMSEPQLGGYKLLIVPGGNSITIGENLTGDTASTIRGAVQRLWPALPGNLCRRFLRGIFHLQRIGSHCRRVVRLLRR